MQRSARVARGLAGNHDRPSGRHHDAVSALAGDGFDRHRLGRAQGLVNQDVFASLDAEGRVAARGVDHPVAAQAAACDHQAVQLDRVAAVDHDVAASARADQLRRSVNVNADAMRIAVAGLDHAAGGWRETAVGIDAAQQRDVAADLGLALPVDPMVGLQAQAAVGSQQLDVAANDHVVVRGDTEGLVVGQVDDRSRQQEPRAALAQQRMRVEHLDRVDRAVVVAVIGLDQVAVAAVV